VIFDLDGTLADVSHRLHYVRGATPDWSAFFAACPDDAPHEAAIALWNMINSAVDAGVGEHTGIARFICSGRPESCRAATVDWLRKHGIFDWQYVLLMRGDDDRRPDHVVKRDMLRSIRGHGYEPLFAVDDRPSVVRMWRENGVTCFACDDAPWREPQAIAFGTTEFPYAGKTLLTLTVGPTQSGKTSWLVDASVGVLNDGPGFYLAWSHVLSSDQVRRDLHDGEYVYDPVENARVFAALYAVARARLNAGLPTVIDATHLRRRERLAAADLAPGGSRVRYLVFDRSLGDKLDTRREEIPEETVWRQDRVFASQLKDVLAGDGRPGVDMVDLRVYKRDG